VSDGEEEIGGDSVVRWLDARQPDYDAAVVFDSSLVEPGRPLLTIGVRGVVTGHLRVTTGTHDVHSGLYGGAGLNAAHVLATLIDGTRARDGLIPEVLRADVREPAPEEIASWATLPSGERELATAGIAPLDDRAVAEFFRRTFSLPTFDVNAISCRDASQHRTIIPYEASAAISLRSSPTSRWRRSGRRCASTSSGSHRPAPRSSSSAGAPRPAAPSTRRCPRS
jgi:acetylornithine deacetylase/succinyl-diaminopimelate desuccinylase-like protein